MLAVFCVLFFFNTFFSQGLILTWFNHYKRLDNLYKFEKVKDQMPWIEGSVLSLFLFPPLFLGVTTNKFPQIFKSSFALMSIQNDKNPDVIGGKMNRQSTKDF